MTLSPVKKNSSFHLALDECYWILSRFTGFYWVLVGFSRFYYDLDGFYWVLLGFTRFTEFY